MSLRCWLVAAYLGAVLLGLAMAAAVPVHPDVDEFSHFDYVAQLAHGVYPIAGTTQIRPETMELMRMSGRFTGDSSLPPVDLSLAHPGQPTPPLRGEARRAWLQRHIWQFSYEAWQPPVYYLISVPFWMAGDALSGPVGATYSVRVLSALLAALIAPLTVLLARALGGPPRVQAVAAVLGAVTPGIAHNLTLISNEVAAVVFGSTALLLAVRGMRHGWTGRAAALLGLATGAALMSKLTAAGLVPGLALGLLWPTPGRLRNAIVACSAGAACVAPWVASNLVFYHAFTPAPGAAVINYVSQPPPQPLVSPGYLLEFTVTSFGTFWAGQGPGTDGVGPLLFVTVLALLTPFALLGVWRLRGNGALVATAVAAAGLIPVSAAIPTVTGYGFVPAGRYLYPALAGYLVLFTYGLWRELGGRALALFGVAYALASLGLLALSPIWQPHPPPALPPVDGGLPVAAVAEQDGFRIDADRFLLQPGAGWVHLRVVNAGSSVVEWTPTPRLEQGAFHLTPGWQRESGLPGAMRPGDQAAGWLRLDRPDAQPFRIPGATVATPRSGDRLRLVFVDVATGDYARVRDLTLELVIP